VVDVAANQARIETLLLDARFAFEDGKVTWPPGDNALEAYTAVLAIDPDNEDGQRGFERILEYYVGEAETAAHRAEFARARSMLDRARLIDPNHPSIKPMANQVFMLSTAIRDRYPLNRRQLSARSAALAKRLEKLGERAKSANMRVIIRSRNDAEGRWIYQQMRKAAGEPRIRAELTIGSPPRVELVDLPAS
jgi:tetratricopeptide (TPR) repeat protein